MPIMYRKIGHLSRQTEMIEKNQMGIPALKRTIAEIANSLEKVVNKQKNH